MNSYFSFLRFCRFALATLVIMSALNGAIARTFNDPSGPNGGIDFPLRHIAFVSIDGSLLTVATPPYGFVEQGTFYIGSDSLTSVHAYMGPNSFSIAGFNITLPDSTYQTFYVLLDSTNNWSHVINADDAYGNMPSALYVNATDKTASTVTSIGSSEIPMSVPSRALRYVSMVGENLSDQIWTKLLYVCDWEQYEVGDPSYSYPSGIIRDDQIMLMVIQPIEVSDGCGMVLGLTRRINKYLWGDLDVDSNNDNGYSDADKSLSEEIIEYPGENGGIGKIIGVNVFDEDGDLIPDFADGFNLEPSDPESANASSSFIPLHLTLPNGFDQNQIRIKFAYSSSDPFTTSVVSEVSSSNTPTRMLERIHSITSGKLRIWNKDGDESRDGKSVTQNGNFVPHDVDITPSQLGFQSMDNETTLYIEAVDMNTSVSQATEEIIVSYSFNSGIDYLEVDKVKVTPVKASYEIGLEHEFGFDDYTFQDVPWVSVKTNETFSALVAVRPPIDLQNDASIFFVPRDTNIATASGDITFSTSTQVVDVTGHGVVKGETTFDVLAGIHGSSNNIGRSVQIGQLRVASYPEVEISLAVIPIHLPKKYGGGYHMPPAIDQASFESYLNNVVYNQCGIKVNVTVLAPKIVNYDLFFDDDKFTLREAEGGLGFPVDWNMKEDEIVIAQAKNDQFDFNMFVVHNASSPHDPGGLPFAIDFEGAHKINTNYSFINGNYFDSPGGYRQTGAHELGHGLDLGHPVAVNNFDPYNLMNSGYLEHANAGMYLLRKYQWDIAHQAASEVNNE